VQWATISADHRRPNPECPQGAQFPATATSLAAEACGLGDRNGWLRVGYDADLLIVDGDPVAKISSLSRPLAVFAGGRRLAGAA
jgi:imidazolonepropionase-like amidohydrolase